MTTKVTDSVMDLTDVRQDITLGYNDDESRQSKIVGLDIPTQNDEATSKQYVDDTIETLLAIKVPAGMGPLAWSGITAPTGWLMCDGQAVSRTTYSDLFGVINTIYGNGDGSTTFNVPDMRGRFPLGLNDSGSGTKRVNRTQAQNLGQNDGQEVYKLQLGEMPSHTHTATITSSGQHSHSNATTDTEPDHTHGITGRDADGGNSFRGIQNWTGNTGYNSGPAGEHDHAVTVPDNASSKHTHPVTIGYTAGNTEHENTPPFLTLNYIIKY